MLVSLSLDAYNPLLREAGGLLQWLSLTGDLAKLLVVFVVVLGLTLGQRLKLYTRELLAQPHPGRWGWFSLHLGAYAFFVWLSFSLFSAAAASEAARLAPVWTLVAVVTSTTWLAALAPYRFWQQLLAREPWSLGLAVGATALVWLLALSTAELWGPLSEATFRVSAFLLSLVSSDAIVVADQRLLGSGDFIVSIAAACSGYEGMGLMLAFTALYLYVYRTDFRFPRVLLLFPIGVMGIWLLNSLRIVALILIGSTWSPDVAVGGFHSQAGWLTFIAAALAILWLAHSTAFFTHSNGTVSSFKSSPESPAEGSGLAVATLVPLVTLLAATLLTQAMSADFVWLYPLRVVATGVAIAWCWRQLALRPYQFRLEPLWAGALVAILWWVAVEPAQAVSRAHVDALGSAHPAVAGLWILLRVAGAAITVPIAEELAFRGYVLCRSSSVEVTTTGRIPFSLFGLVVSAVTFGLLHGAWIAGTLAGVIYGLVRFRSPSIADAILAHAVTNALLCLVVLLTGAWYLL